MSRVLAESVGAAGAGEIQIPIPNGLMIKIDDFFDVLNLEKQ